MNINKPWLTMIGLPLLGIALTVWGMLFMGNEKALSFEIISAMEFSSKSVDNWEEFSMFYQDTQIKNGGVLTIRLVNNGDIPIYPDEYDSPIKVVPIETSNFIGVKIISTKPENLNPIASIENGTIKIEPTLFNPTDEIVIQAISTGTKIGANANARIGGVYKIEDINISKQKDISIFSWVLILYVLLGFTVYSLVGDLITEKLFSKREHVLSIRAYVLIVVFAFISALSAISYLMSIHNIDLAWNLLWYLIPIIIFSETAASFFKKKMTTVTNET